MYNFLHPTPFFNLWQDYLQLIQLLISNYLKYSKCIKIKILALLYSLHIIFTLLLKMEAQLFPQTWLLLSRWQSPTHLPPPTLLFPEGECPGLAGHQKDLSTKGAFVSVRWWMFLQSRHWGCVPAFALVWLPAFQVRRECRLGWLQDSF